MRVTKQMQILDIPVSGATTPAPELVLSGPTSERIKKTDINASDVKDGARFFQDDLLVRLANKGQLYPNATINMA